MASTSWSRSAAAAPKMPGWMVLLPPTISRVLASASRLLEDFLLHVVLVVAEFDGGGGKLRDMHRAFDRGAVEAGDRDAGCGQLGDIAVFQIDHVAGDLQQRRGVGGGVVAGVGEAEQQRRAFAGDDDLAGLLVVDDGDGVGADELRWQARRTAANRSGSLLSVASIRWAMLSVSVSEVKT